MKRFVIEDDGIKYLITDYRYVKGELQTNPFGFWKFPLEKPRKEEK